MALKVQKANPLANVKIVGEGFDNVGGRYLKLEVSGSVRPLPPYSMDQILKPDQIYRDLSNAGANVFSLRVQRQLLDMFQNYRKQKPSFSVVTRLGSFSRYYVRPTKIIGRPLQPVELALSYLDPHMLEKYRSRGTLEEWQQKIGEVCTGNSRLMFAASLACTGPVLPLVSGPRTGGFQIVGKAETGKTAMAMVAGSIWGCHRDSARKEKGFAESWNTTINELEQTAQAHCDALLILDETNVGGDTEKKRAETILNGAFRLSEPTKKKRYNEPETAPAWRLYFLSTSNLSLDQLAKQGQVSIDDQHRGRLVDILLPLSSNCHGIYESLHGFSNGAELTDAIKARCRSKFGTPGYRLVCKIYQDENSRLATKDYLADRRKSYIRSIDKKAKAKHIKPLQRATARFATVYAAGCLAIKHEIFPWDRKDLLQAVLSCQLDALLELDDGNLDPLSSLRTQLAEYIHKNRSHFMNLNSSKPSLGDHKFGSVPGYAHTHNGVDWLYLTPDQLQAIIGRQKIARRLKEQLIRQKLMDSSGTRSVVQRPIFGARGNKGYRWVHAFKASLVEALVPNSITAPRRIALNKNK